MSKKFLITIVGPTAIGKTSLAIAVAKFFDSQILSSDSRQFYKEMKIGTAVPTNEELSQVPHHFIQHISIEQNYSVGDFERDALVFIQKYFEKNNILVMAGGSGLYEKAVTEGLDSFPRIDNSYRLALNHELKQNGLEILQHELEKKDIAYYQVADIQNPHRVIRALEIIRSTGKTFSSFLNQQKQKRNFEVIKVGLTTDRPIIYARINERVEAMIEAGLIEEAKGLLPKKNLNALQTVGYKELFDYLEGKISLELAFEEIKKNTRRFAKRQLTWYRKDDSINWFQPGESQKVIDFIWHKINVKY